MKWVLDKTMSDPYFGGKMKETLEAMGREIVIADYCPVFGIKNKADINDDDRYIGYGSLQLMTELQKNFHNVATFGPGSKYFYNYYSSLLPCDKFITCDSMIITVSCLLDNSKVSFLKEIYGNKVFIRPNTGYKLFSGQVIDLRDNRLINALFNNSSVSMSTLIVISSAVNIIEEYRLFVSSKNGVLSSSSYSAYERGNEKEGAPESARFVAEEAMNYLSFDIDQILVIDVGLVNYDDMHERMAVIEVNCASSSGMYMCNPEPIILEMERIIEVEDNIE